MQPLLIDFLRPMPPMCRIDRRPGHRPENMATQRPALCTVSRGARTICRTFEDEIDTYVVGCALSNTSSNDVSTITHSSNTLSVASSNSHAFEVWSLSPLHTNIGLVAGTRTGEQSHIRILSPVCDVAKPIPGRVVAVDAFTSDYAVAVTSNSVSMWNLGKSGGNDLVASGLSSRTDDMLMTYEDDNIVSGGHIFKRFYTASNTGVISFLDARCTYQPDVKDASLSPGRKLRISCTAPLLHRDIVLCSEHGDLALFDQRYPEAPVKTKADAHAGWISAVGTSGQDTIITGGADGVVRVWTNEFECTATLPLHADSVYGITASDDKFATVSYEGRVALNTIPRK